MRPYASPTLTDFGDVTRLTATLGNPFTGDVAFDVDGNVIETGENSVNQCPALEGAICELPGENSP